MQLFNDAIKYIGALIKFAHHGIIVSEHIYNKRVEICKECPHNINNVCSECHCRLEGDDVTISKLLMSSEHCPLHKWCDYDSAGVPILRADRQLYSIDTTLKLDGTHTLSTQRNNKHEYVIPTINVDAPKKSCCGNQT